MTKVTRAGQIISPLWWLENHRYLLYFFRELTGPIIAFYAAYFLFQWYLDPNFAFAIQPSFRVVSRIAFFAAIFHALTWFWVTAKLTPFRPFLQKIFFILLIIFWYFLSFILTITFYISS